MSTKYQRLEKAVEKAVDDLFAQFGPESAVIVMVGIQDGKKHSAFQYEFEGRCLPVEGLLVRVARDLQNRLWKRRPASTETPNLSTKEKS